MATEKTEVFEKLEVRLKADYQRLAEQLQALKDTRP